MNYLVPIRFQLLISCLGLVVSLHHGESRAQEEFKPIFDGHSLAGWEGDAQYWRVEQGAIVGEIPANERLQRNTWLIWREGTVTDFELVLQFRLTGLPAANSGIQFRCQAESTSKVAGYQADLDMGATWLGRIYDEHGRALLVERGQRVLIDRDGQRRVEAFAPADQFAVLFRENDWNEYRIIASGSHMSVFINGTLFSELVDTQADEHDLEGGLAFQLHSGPETRIEFRDIRLRKTGPKEHRVEFAAPEQAKKETSGVFPRSKDGRELNFGFEQGDLTDWTATGTAFDKQPINRDGIAARWRGQTSRKMGDYFIGGFEVGRDQPVGRLESVPFIATHPYASYLLGGGEARSTRVEVLTHDDGRVVHSASGSNREEMRRIMVDLRPVQGRQLVVHVVDESSGGWGHLNFDDFRLHESKPEAADSAQNAWRSTFNPLLSHLRPNPLSGEENRPADKTMTQIFLPDGFVAEVVAAEPLIHQPMAFTFDERGRLWVVEGNSYPQKRPVGEGLDRVLIFEDADGDGSFESRKIFTEGLNLVSGLEVGHGGVWIGAAPELLFIPDQDRNDIPDADPVVLLDGFGFADTHETLNSFAWGPDGWLYGNQGVFNVAEIGPPGATSAERVTLRAGVWRYHPTKHRFEVFAHGGSNQWGLDFDQFGQLFMTHCRSRWGGGPTTHVIQGGHYWNQTNSNHAPFVSGTAPSGMPFMRNYLRASARYGHGEGGAGKAGSRIVYGGHSHVGTMIYQGDNWPESFRNHLFTHNLHGHQLNHQVNVREGSGYNTIHAGHDLWFCADPQYIGVDLKYGPDGAVYVSDWYDPRHCHNPNTEQWDRSNGRMYRIAYASTYRPYHVDLATWSDRQLVEAQAHPNEWYGRTARRLLQERAANGELSPETIARLKSVASTDSDLKLRLRAIWSLHVVNGLDAGLIVELMADPSEYVRAWAVQLATESDNGNKKIHEKLVHLASHDTSLFVRIYLASAMQRVSPETGWKIAESLSQQTENDADQNLSLMTWYGVAHLMPQSTDRAMRIAERSSIPDLSSFIYWYATKLPGDGLTRIVSKLEKAHSSDRIELLQLVQLGIAERRGLEPPKGWEEIATSLYASSDRQLGRVSELVGAALGDKQLFTRKRQLLARNDISMEDRRHAFRILAHDLSTESLPTFLSLLDDAALRSHVIPLLAAYHDAAAGQALIDRFSSMDPEEKRSTLNVLTSREAYGHVLLDAIAKGTIDKNQLTSFHARQLANIPSEQLMQRVISEWGMVGATSQEREDEVNRIEAAFNRAPLWAYDRNEGSRHFQRLCASCHSAGNGGTDIGPKLAGMASKGSRYAVENIVDPNAVIGEDFQLRLFQLEDGRVVSGIVESENGSAITVRTVDGNVVIARDEIEEMRRTSNSLMPEGLLQSLNDREKIELLKFVMSL